MAAKSQAGRRFDQLSKQRLDFSALPGGGQRARLTLTLAGSSRPFTFIEDVHPWEALQYQRQVAGVEVGLIQEVGGIRRVGAAAGIPSAAQLRSMFDSLPAANKQQQLMSSLTRGGLGKAGKTVAKGIATAAIATAKVMQTAAQGLAVIAPALGPLAPAAMGVAGAIGVAGKLASAKNAADVGATLTAAGITNSAIKDAQRLAPAAFGSLLQIANEKANSARSVTPGAHSQGLPRALALAPSGGSDAMALVTSGRVRSDQGGPVTAAQLMAAQMGGRLFFVS